MGWALHTYHNSHAVWIFEEAKSCMRAYEARASCHQDVCDTRLVLRELDERVYAAYKLADSNEL